MNTKSTYFAPIVTVISTLISILIGLRAIQKSSKRMWLSNMIGGIIFSQLQTEYLIWRINKRTEQAKLNDFTYLLKEERSTYRLYKALI